MCLLHYLQLPQLQLQLTQQWVLVPYTFYSTFHLSLLPVWFGSVGQGNTSEKTIHLFTLETIRISRWVLLTSDVNIGTFCIKQLTLCVSEVFFFYISFSIHLLLMSDKGTEEYWGCKYSGVHSKCDEQVRMILSIFLRAIACDKMVKTCNENLNKIFRFPFSMKKLILTI